MPYPCVFFSWRRNYPLSFAKVNERRSYDLTEHASSSCNRDFPNLGESISWARTAQSERLVLAGVDSKSGAARNYSGDGKTLDSSIWRLGLQIVCLEYASCGRLRRMVHRNIFLLLVARAAAQEWILACIPSSPSFAVAN